MAALAIPPSQLWWKALICLLLLYEAGKQDAATGWTVIFLPLCNTRSQTVLCELIPRAWKIPCMVECEWINHKSEPNVADDSVC